MNLDYQQPPDSPEKRLGTLARQHNSRLVTSRDQLNGSGGNLQGFSHGLLRDALAMPELLSSYVGDRVDTLLEDPLSELVSINLWPSPKEITQPNIVMIPGYAASIRHLSTLMARLGKRAIREPGFEDRKLKTRVLDDARLLADNTIRKGQPVNFCAHSRGGLIALCTMQILQDLGRDDLITEAFLLSPTSRGIRPGLGTIAKHLGIGAIEDLCPGSEATHFWHRLSPGNREKLVIVSQDGGDGFTSPEQSFVDGAQMLVTPHCGHQEAIRDPKTDYFKLSVALMN